MEIEFIKDFTMICANLAVVIGLWVAFSNWHREHRGRRNIELAEETLALFYEAKDVISWLRFPGSFENETDSVEQKSNETEEAFRARKRASIIFVRYNQHKELFSKIQSLRYRFMAQIGKEKAKPFDTLNQVVKEIIASAHMLAMLWPEEHFMNEEEKKMHYEQIRKHERVFYDRLDENDPINPKLDKIISEIEEICQKVIMGKGDMWHKVISLLNSPIMLNKK